MAEHGVEKEPLGIDGTTLQMLYARPSTEKKLRRSMAKPTMDEARTIKTQDEMN